MYPALKSKNGIRNGENRPAKKRLDIAIDCYYEIIVNCIP